jgi:hypothetical protein
MQTFLAGPHRWHPLRWPREVQERHVGRVNRGAGWMKHLVTAITIYAMDSHLVCSPLALSLLAM